MKKPRRPIQPEIHLDEARVARGTIDYRSLSVTIEPELGVVQDSPVIAALEKLPAPVDVIELRSKDGGIQLVPKRWQKLSFGGGRTLFQAARERPEEITIPLRVVEAIEYATGLLRQYRTDFDSLAAGEQTRLLATTITQINALSERLRLLEAHLKYAEPDRKGVPPIKDPERAVHATLLKEVHGYGHVRIGEMLNIPAPESAQDKRDNPTVRRMIKDRGGPLLERHYGPEEWQAKVRRMRVERERWKKLAEDPKAYSYALLAEARGTSVQEEEHAAVEDGFDNLLGQFLDTWDREQLRRRYSIMRTDPRFGEILRTW